MTVELIPVETKAELERFIRVPMRLSAGDPKWVAPLMFERREALSKKINPFFQHADAQFWLARKDGRDVGRISAQIDHLAKTDPDAPAGYFGMIAAEDDPEVFAALFRTAEDWLRARGRIHAMGPFNLSINEEVGLLIDGFDTRPMFMMGHDQPYVAARVEEQGYGKVKDVYAYISETFVFNDLIEKRLKRPLPEGMVLRPVRMNRFREEVAIFTDILNDAWSDNWGAAAITEAEAKYLGDSLGLILKKEWFWFIEIDGEPAAFIILLPNIVDMIHDLKGRLAPFGWAKLIWRLKFQPIRSARVPLMGVRKKFQKDRRGALAPFVLIDAIRAQSVPQGLQRAEYSWILENNKPMRHILEGLNARIYKTYRIYGKQIAPTPAVTAAPSDS
jgi:hypothetical protein